jgi:hypothetical protein
MLINDMMFGGSLSDMFQNSFMLLLPEWYMNGAARYTAYGWDVEMDDFIRTSSATRASKTSISSLPTSRAAGSIDLELHCRALW